MNWKKLTALSLVALVCSTTSLGIATAKMTRHIPEKLAKEQFLERNIKEMPASFDPGKIGDTNSMKVAVNFFDPLVRQSPDGPYVGAAAKSWTVSKDGKTYTFKLQPKGVWSDGKPVTAQDFVYAWQRLTDPRNGSPYNDYLTNAHVVNAAEVAAGKLPPSALGVKALDKQTFQVQLTQPTPWFIQLISVVMLSPIREDVVNKYGDRWTQVGNIVTNGPYLLHDVRVNDHIYLKKFPKYWDADNVLITDSTYIFATDINVVYSKYLTNELKTADIPPNIYQKVLTERPKEVKSYLDPYLWYFDFNVKQVPDQRVRTAIKYLVDSKFLTDKILKAGKATSIFAPTFLQDGQLATEEAYFKTAYKTNVQKAITLLKQAGYSASKPFKLHLTTGRDQLINNIIVAFQGWIEQNSQGLIKFSYQSYESKIYEDLVQKRDFQVRLAWYKSDYDQASSFYNILLCNNSQNSSGWCNKQYDQLVTKANATVNATERAKLYAQANKVIQQETPVSPIYVKGAYLLQSPALGGLSLKVKNRFLRDYYIIADQQVAPTK